MMNISVKSIQSLCGVTHNEYIDVREISTSAIVYLCIIMYKTHKLITQINVTY